MLVALLYLGIAALPSAAETPLRSGCEVDYPPFCLVHDNGEADGFSVELLRAALARMGREVTFRTGTWNHVRGWLEQGEIDVLPLVGRTPEREALFDFTVPYLTMHGAIVVREGTTDVGNLADLQGRRVAVLAGDNAEEFLRREPRGIEIITTPTYPAALDLLSGGGCDAVVIQRLLALRLLAELGYSDLRIVDRPIRDFRQDFCFAVREGDKETLSLLNEGLALVVADGTHRRLHAAWFAALELPSDRPIVFGGGADFPPFAFLDDRGRPDGFNVELVQAIAHAMDLDIRIELGPWAETLGRFERGDIDAMLGMFYSAERDQLFDFSTPYTVAHYVSVVRRGDMAPPQTLGELADLDVVLQENDLVHGYLLEKGFQGRITTLGKQQDVLRALAEGRHDCALVARLPALAMIEKHGWDNLVLDKRPFLEADYCFTVPNGNRAMLATLNEGLASLEASGEFRRIHDTWLGVYEGEVHDWRTLLTFAAGVVVPLLLVAVLALLWSWALRRQVAERTAELAESAELQRAMVACSPVALFSVDIAGIVLSWNPSAERMFGWTADEVVGRHLPFVPKDSATELDRLAQLVIAGKGFVGCEEMPQRNGGERFPASFSGAPIRDSAGNVVAVMAAAEDISERRLQEQALRRIEWMLTPGHERHVMPLESAYGNMVELNQRRVILDAVGPEPLQDIVRDFLSLLDSSAVVYEDNGDYACVIVSSDWCRLLDERSRQLCKTPDNAAAMESGCWHCHESCWHDAGAQAMRLGKPVDVPCAGGLRLYAVPILAAGQVVGAATVGYGDPPRDRPTLERISAIYGVPVDELSRAAEAYESRPLYILDTAKRRLETSARLIGEIVERSRAQARLGHQNTVLRAIRDVNQLIMRERDPQRLIRTACQLLVERGSYRWALVALGDADGKVTQFEQDGIGPACPALREHLYAGNLPPCCAGVCGTNGVFVAEPGGTSCTLSCAMESGDERDPIMWTVLRHGDRVFGFLAVSGHDGVAVSDADEEALLQGVAVDLGYALNGIESQEAREQAEKGRESAQQQLLQAQKMESVGRLAGGIAHDFNNLLTGIMNYVTLCRDAVGPTHAIREWLDDINRDAERSANLTRQLLAFARRQTIAPRVLNLNDAVGSALKMLRRLIGEDVELVWIPGGGSLPVCMDPTQIDQVLTNLCLNARDAIGDVGKVIIETGTVTLDEAYCMTHPEALPGRFVTLAVSDDGCGMDQQTLAQVFEPFFTTKRVGEGTGLGLPMVHGIVKQNNGFITVYSEPGKGTTFRLYLPRVSREPESEEALAECVAAAGGGEVILLVEDERSIRITTKIFLERMGYTTLAAETPQEALALAADYPTPIHLLVTDVVMPGMNGRELAGVLSRSNPALKCLFISGYTANVIAHRGILDAEAEFLAKPFSREQLMTRVRAILDDA